MTNGDHVLENGIKNHLPPSSSITNTQLPEPAPRQIGVIRPLVAESKLLIPPTEHSLSSPPPFTNNSHSNNKSDRTVAVKPDSTRDEALKMQPSVMPSTSVASTVAMTIDPDDLVSSSDPPVGDIAWINHKPSAAAANTLSSNGQSNSIVFNFQDRIDVPDYIDASVIFRPERGLPKADETGHVWLNGITVDTDTDDLWSFRNNPPSPCNVAFENANVIINGRSNIKNRVKDQRRMSIQFNESLTSTFEYPAECCVSEDGTISPAVDDGHRSNSDGNSNFMASTPILSVPLGNYVPMKASTFSNDFQLGVTRTQHNNMVAAANGINEHESDAGVSDTANGNDDIKPANDEQTIAWSEGVSDMLF